MVYSKGIMWLDDCRIPFVDEGENTKRKISGLQDKIVGGNLINNYNIENQQDRDKGRFTPNLLVCDDMLNDGSVTKQSKRKYKPTDHKGSLFGNSSQGHGEGIGDKGTNSRYYNLDLWFNKMVDEL